MSINRLVSSSDKYFLQQISNNTKTSGADNIKSNTPVSTQSTLQSVGIYGRDPTDTWKSLQVDANGVLAVDLSIDETSLATSALQTSGNSTLSSIETNTELKVPGSRSECLPVQLCVGSTGAEYNALRSVNGDLAIYIDDMNPDVATNSGLATKAVQDSQQTTLNSIDGKIATCDTDDVVIRGSVYPLASSALQTSGNSTLSSIETNTELKVPGSRTECLPVQLCVGTTGGSYNTLRSIGQDLGVYIDDMNPDVATNSGLSTKAVQDSQQTTLTSIDGKTILPVALSGSGNLKVSIEEGAIPAITGFSTSAKQDLMVTDLGVIKSDTTSLDTKLILPAALSASGNLKCSIEETGALTKTHVDLYTNGTGTAGSQSSVITMGERTNLSLSGSTSSSGGQLAVAYKGIGGVYNTNPSYASLQNISGTYHFNMTVSNIGADSVKLTFLTTCSNLDVTTSTY